MQGPSLGQIRLSPCRQMCGAIGGREMLDGGKRAEAKRGGLRAGPLCSKQRRKRLSLREGNMLDMSAEPWATLQPSGAVLNDGRLD